MSEVISDAAVQEIKVAVFAIVVLCELQFWRLI
jgi:hypothetical protein